MKKINGEPLILKAWDAIVQRCEELTAIECAKCEDGWCPIHDGGPRPIITAPMYDHD